MGTLRGAVVRMGTGMLLAALLALPSAGQVTVRISLDSDGAQGNDESFYSSISADGRCVAFTSDAANLVPGDTNGHADVFVRDRMLGTTERVSVSTAGTQGNADSLYPSISADGRYVGFESEASNLVSAGTNGIRNVFLRDRRLGTTELVSLGPAGTPGNAYSSSPSISADGRYVSFWSNASNLVPGDTNGYPDVFVRDRRLGLTERVSLDSAGAQGNRDSATTLISPSISADGRYVAFWSNATNLVAGDTNGETDVFVRDRELGTTERVSLDSTGAQGNGTSLHPSISADGRYVEFTSGATNLVFGDTNGYPDIFVRDRQLGATERVNLDSAGAQVGGWNYPGWISGDGRYVVFGSDATGLVPGDTNDHEDVFVRDRRLGTTERASVDSAGLEGNDDSFTPSISADGRFVSFTSVATHLVPQDTNGTLDIFVRDRLGGPAVSSVCHPGVGGVIACPCSNPPSGPFRGCDNSAGTGGAMLTASGATVLSSDSLVFTSQGERPTATSILLQGTAYVWSGLPYGQGVRCLSGVRTRLFTKIASGGAVTAPDFAEGDRSVSARSSRLGDPIAPGESRWYHVLYRDPVVLGNCPAARTFNATQTLEVAWSP